MSVKGNRKWDWSQPGQLKRGDVELIRMETGMNQSWGGEWVWSENKSQESY